MSLPVDASFSVTSSADHHALPALGGSCVPPHIVVARSRPGLRKNPKAMARAATSHGNMPMFGVVSRGDEVRAECRQREFGAGGNSGDEMLSARVGRRFSIRGICTVSIAG